MKSVTKITALAVVVASHAATTAQAFVAPSSPSSAAVAFSSSSASSSPSILPLAATKGFGSPPPEPRKKSSGAVDRETKASKYDEIAGAGGQEYRVFVRQFGSDDRSWLPVGSVAVPRGAQVSDAVFANEDGLRKAIVRTYDKLRGMETEFEYGYNLKIYPDDPIQVAMKGQGAKSSDGPSLGNWISNLLSPVDASGVAPPPMPKED